MSRVRRRAGMPRRLVSYFFLEGGYREDVSRLAERISEGEYQVHEEAVTKSIPAAVAAFKAVPRGGLIPK